MSYLSTIIEKVEYLVTDGPYTSLVLRKRNRSLVKIPILADVQPSVSTAAIHASLNLVHDAGRLIIASDTGVLKVGDGATPYNSLPSYRQVPSKQRATTAIQQSGISSSTPVDLANLATVTFEVTASMPWEVELWHPYLQAITNPAAVNITITDAADAVKEGGNVSIAAAGGVAQCRCVEHISTPGVYVRKGRIRRVSGTGTITSLSGFGEAITLTARPAP